MEGNVIRVLNDQVPVSASINHDAGLLQDPI